MNEKGKTSTEWGSLIGLIGALGVHEISDLNLISYEVLTVMAGLVKWYIIGRSAVKVSAYLGGRLNGKTASASVALLVALGLATFAIAPSAHAGVGLNPDRVQAGTALDWFDRGNGSGMENLTQLQVAYAFDQVFTETNGLSVLQRVLASPSTDGTDDNDWVTEFAVEYWHILFDGNLETFVGGGLSIWGKNITGNTETLGGVRAGIRLPLEGDVLFEVSGRWYKSGDLTQGGLVFGPSFPIGS